jgi:Adenylate and Guanylate cyclase catalytic domain
LRELGVGLVGVRRRLLGAIAALAPAPTVEPGAPPPRPVARQEAERRQVTILFCDLVGSTALLVRLDPEDLRSVIGAYRRCCAGVIESAGGFIAKYMGDGVLAYFGYPRADEHVAERAVRAGLQLIQAVGRLETAANLPPQARVGIATGLVVGYGEVYQGPRVFKKCSLPLGPGFPCFRSLAGRSQRVCSPVLFTRALLCLGHLDKARLFRSEALTEARQLSPFNVAYALYHSWLGDWAM